MLKAPCKNQDSAECRYAKAKDIAELDSDLLVEEAGDDVGNYLAARARGCRDVYVIKGVHQGQNQVVAKGAAEPDKTHQEQVYCVLALLQIEGDRWDGDSLLLVIGNLTR